MAESIADLLGRKNLDEPPEVQIIKSFVSKHYKASCNVNIQPQQIIIVVKGASLAGAIRIRLHELQALCQTDKRLVLRIIG